MLNNRGSNINVKKCLHEGVILPTAMHRAQRQEVCEVLRKKVNVLEMKCLRNLVRMTRMKSCIEIIIIIYHDFLPTPRSGSHVKSHKTHTQSSRYTHPLAHILDT